MKREFKATELWVVLLFAGVWIYDRHNGTDLVSTISPEISAQVASIAASYKQQFLADNNLLLYLAGIVYGLKKWEKVKGSKSEKVTAP